MPEGRQGAPRTEQEVYDSLELAVEEIGRENVRALAAAAVGRTDVRPRLAGGMPYGVRRYLQAVLAGRRDGIRARESLSPGVRRVLEATFRRDDG